MKTGVAGAFRELWIRHVPTLGANAAMAAGASDERERHEPMAPHGLRDEKREKHLER